MDPNLQSIKEKIKHNLDELYREDAILFERNNGEGLGERCITFRFAMYMQNQFDDYYVDVEHDNSGSYEINNFGLIDKFTENKGKRMPDPDGIGQIRKIPDIIIHKRDLVPSNAYLCFELKKWNRLTSDDVKKDHYVLQNLTSSYMYKFGFHIIFGKEKEETKWTIFQRGKIIEDNVLVFENSV